jgi:stage II sporulation protein D
MKPLHSISYPWTAFACGVFAATIAWLALHRGGESSTGRENVLAFIGEQTMGEQAVTAPDKSDNTAPKKVKANQLTYQQPMIRVYISDSRTIETVPLETYVRGVVAAEMPLEFEPAALEAQAMAARTYIIRRLWLKDRTGIQVDNADVTDTQTHQVYRSLSDMKRLQLENESGWSKVEEAVSKTAGEIIVYRGEPIEALFFSTSNGYTENSEEVFPARLPYLRSVASPWDKENSPRARDTVELRLTDFYEMLGVKSMSASSNRQARDDIRVLEWTQGHRIKQLLAGGEKISGEEVRHRLGLRSASFDWKVADNKIVFTTYGSGHGVGMSQWGAEGMAKAGKTAVQIVEYYYSGTRTEEVSKLAKAFD